MATYSVFTVTADKSALPSDGSLAATITAIIHDDTGAPAPDGTTVNWTVTAGGKLSAATSTTDASGAAIVEVTAIASGILTVTATTADDDTGKQTSIYASTALPAPTVSGATEADQYTLDYYDLQLGVQMVIPHYPNATAGDRSPSGGAITLILLRFPIHRRSCRWSLISALKFPRSTLRTAIILFITPPLTPPATPVIPQPFQL